MRESFLASCGDFLPGIFDSLKCGKIFCFSKFPSWSHFNCQDDFCRLEASLDLQDTIALHLSTCHYLQVSNIELAFWHFDGFF